MNSFSIQSKARCGEEYVRLLYEKYNYELLAQNFRRVGTELDLVFMKNKTLVFVEVKLRKNLFVSDIRVEDLVSQKKQQALKRGAQLFMQEYENLNYENIRFDLCLVGYHINKTLLKVNKVKIYRDFLFALR
jgi:Holliday junction resolvase-like predicted endonuclease